MLLCLHPQSLPIPGWAGAGEEGSLPWLRDVLPPGRSDPGAVGAGPAGRAVLTQRKSICQDTAHQLALLGLLLICALQVSGN